jgi:hypothetical protein
LAQDTENILPKYLNLDASYENLQPDESPYLAGLESGINGNPELGIGTNNPTGEGSNTLLLTPSRSNVAIPDVLLPDGYNKNIGSFESITTQEIYYCNYNSNGNYGIYVFNGNTGIHNKVIVDSELLFSDDPIAFMASHRFTLRVRKDKFNNIVEKYLLITDGVSYHKWIDVIAAIETDGFNATTYPYFTLQPPHFDRQELLAWAVRSPMVAPVVTPLPNTNAEKGLPNKILGAAFQFCFQFNNTDGTQSLSSPFSLPAIIKVTDFLSNPDLISKRLLLTMVAGSCKTESITIYVRKTQKKSDSTLQNAFGDWFLYDTIYKFTDSGVNDPAVIGNKYWLRTGAWSLYGYDSTFNTIQYVFDNSKLLLITSQDLFTRLGNEMPQLSISCSDLGDAVQLANNRYGFDNFSNTITDKLSTTVIEKTIDSCSIPLREVKIYAYVGRERGNSSSRNSPRVRNIWQSQVGYYNGDDTQMRFGGMYVNGQRGSETDQAESKFFELDFADKTCFRVYLNGTQYYADGEWYVSTEDYKLQKIDHLLDFSKESDISFAKNIIRQYGFFVVQFTLKVPAGRYIASVGRHNISSEGNYRDTSTYVIGVANSRAASKVNYFDDGGMVIVNTVKMDAVVSYNKDIEIDCTAGDVDLWGRGALGDMFYIFTPFWGYSGGNTTRWQFVEGYLYESQTDKVPIELFTYGFYLNSDYGTGGERGIYTDKNGFFFANTWGDDTRQDNQDIRFTIKKDCSYPFNFVVPIPDGPDWKRDIEVYFDTYNGNTVGTANRVLVEGYVRDLTNLIPYSNIAVSISNGQTAYTDSNGFFSLIVHNGLNIIRGGNIYVNASGNFNLTITNCDYVPLFNYTEPICQTTQVRRTPLLTVNVNAQGSEAVSLKQGASYLVCVVGADLACRVTYCNKFSLQNIQSFQERNNINSTAIGWQLTGNLELQNDIRTMDLKWLAFYIINATNYKKYIQWVGDKIEFIDANGNVTSNTASASLVRINISSLLETNIKNNFTLLSNYQFQKEDRIRILDDGSGNLLDTATYGDIIDLEVQGTNYNQAAINANLIPPSENVVLNNNAAASTDPTTIYIKYDKRFDVLKNKTGFWIEIYTPAQTTEKLPLSQVESFYPIIDGEIAIYTGGGASNPTYTYPKSGVLNYWDTYLLRRNIIGLGQFISHFFESPNITDGWGANVTSGGKVQTINPNARQQWYNDSTIKSDDYITEGIINGLSFFRTENIKSFKGYQRGGIVAISCQFSIVMFICENDWFVTDYNFNYIYANAQGVQVANLDNNLSVPHQKIGQNFGCRLQDTGTVLTLSEYVWWSDSKNQAEVLCDYREAVDVSDITDKDQKKYGIKSYLVKKLNAIEGWNLANPLNKRFDRVSGFDVIRKNIHITFRPRRENSNNALSYVNRRRNISTLYQETLVYNLDSKRWSRFSKFTPEGYGGVMGNATGNEFISFAAGKPYLHNSGNESYLNYYGVQTEPVLITSLNKDEDIVKILGAMSLDINNSVFFSDLIYSTQVYGYSYLPLNYFLEEEKMYYAAFLRDMVSYLQDPVNNDFRSTLIEGKRLFGEYFIMRFIQEYDKLGQYFELNKLSFLYTSSVPVKPPAK